jgi:hypothetical protein
MAEEGRVPSCGRGAADTPASATLDKRETGFL